MDYLNGAISGSIGCLMSHPFDTIRIRKQNKTISFSPSPSISISILNPNISGYQKYTDLYSGFNSAVLSLMLEKSIVFGTYSFANRYIKTDNTSLNTALSGMIAGFTCSFIVSPCERLKILRQQNQGKHYIEFLNRNLFKGLSATFMRETPGFGIYFSTYEFLKRKTQTKMNLSL